MAGKTENFQHSNKNILSIIDNIIEKENFTNCTREISAGSAKGDNFMGIVYRVKMFGKREGVQKHLHLIVKTTPDLPSSPPHLDIFFERETYFYNIIAPEFEKLQKNFDLTQKEKFNFVKYYYGNSARAVIVLEDLCVGGFRMANSLKRLDLEHIKLTIEKLAKYHALSFALKKHHPEKMQKISASARGDRELCDSYKNFVEIETERAIAVMDDEVCKRKLVNFKKTAYKMIADNSNGILTNPYNVMCHGDCWTNNLLFKYRDDKPVDLRMLDWQMSKFCSPVVDLSYLLFISTEQDFRNLHFSDLLDIYYATLKSQLTMMDCDVSSCYPENVYREQLIHILPYGLSMALANIPLVAAEAADLLTPQDIANRSGTEYNHRIEPFKDSRTQIQYEKRIRGIVKDFVKMNLI